jgi:16S rRNA (cytosine967-C5)-methyltransferase
VVAGDVTKTRAFREGRVAVQDEASQLVALLVGRGPRILDCCAAPGGKTAVLAERNPGSKIIAAELHQRRAELLRKRVTPNVEVRTQDVTALAGEDDFERVLADVPCSGTGTLARNPEIKWRLKPEDFEDLHRRQVAILRAAVRHATAGGRVVYATCSLEQEEDESVVEEVVRDREVRVVEAGEELARLAREGELACRGETLASGRFMRTVPGIHPCDGFFAAVLEKNPIAR